MTSVNTQPEMRMPDFPSVRHARIAVYKDARQHVNECDGIVLGEVIAVQVWLDAVLK